MRRYCTICHAWTDHKARKHSADRRRNDMSKEGFRAISWLHFWEQAGCPKWRACGFGLVYGDGVMGAAELPL